jgi:ketosteroid isomerase-like protein
VSEHAATVERYLAGHRNGDIAQIGACLHDDVVWALHGDKTLTGRPAFEAECQHDGPSPVLFIDQMLESGEAVAVRGRGNVDMGGGVPVDFAFAEFFTFAGGLISRLDTYHVWLGG